MKLSSHLYKFLFSPSFILKIFNALSHFNINNHFMEKKLLLPVVMPLLDANCLQVRFKLATCLPEYNKTYKYRSFGEAG